MSSEWDLSSNCGLSIHQTTSNSLQRFGLRTSTVPTKKEMVYASIARCSIYYLPAEMLMIENAFWLFSLILSIRLSRSEAAAAAAATYHAISAPLSARLPLLLLFFNVAI